MTSTPKQQETIKNLFEFIKYLDNSKHALLQTVDSPKTKTLWFDEIDETLPGVEKWSKDHLALPYLCRVAKVAFPPVPTMPEVLKDWLEPGIDLRTHAPSFLSELTKVHFESKALPDGTSEEVAIEETFVFDDDPLRLEAKARWADALIPFREECATISKTHDLFNQFVLLKTELERSELKKECLIGNFFFEECSKDQAPARIKYPLITVPIELSFEGGEVPSIVMSMRSAEPLRFNAQILTKVDDSLVDVGAFSFVDSLLETESEAHLMNWPALSNGFKQQAVLFSEKCRWLGEEIHAPKEGDIRYVLYERPVFFIQDRQSGLPFAIDGMNKAIEEGAEIPSLLKELACKDASIAPSRENYREPSPSEKLAVTSGESPQILLTKPGNAEQLAIAQKLEHNQQMLVQGPPGTGKTHTIANLMGHFLAQGKRILVTSEKLKALSVLKEKLSPELQNLCISYTGRQG